MKRLFCTMFLFLTVPFALFAEDSKCKALLISIEKYEIAPLDFAARDVGTLATLLMTRYDCEPKALIDFVKSRPDEAPKGPIMQEIEAWCRSLQENDTAILYIAGHGVKDADGKIYLAMIDFDTKNFDTAAVPIHWIRECFEKAAPSKKVIFVDTCFAGTSKSIDFNRASAQETSQAFSETPNVAVVASSQSDEQSWLWGEAKHSLFTYWLIEALKGHADTDDDRTITFDELTSYLQTNVSRVAQDALGKSQRPVILNKQVGKELAFPLRAVPLSELMEDIATQVNLQMEIDSVPLIAVAEFTTGTDNSFGREYGALSKWMADSLRRSLTTKAQRRYKVVAENATQALFRKHGLLPNDLGTEKTATLKVDGREIPFLVTGKLSFVGETGISLRVQVIDARDQTERTQIGGTARLNAKEMVMAGVSGKFAVASSNPSVATSAERQESAQPTSQDSAASTTSSPQQYHNDPAVGLVTENENRESEQVRQERQQPHPLSDPKFAWKTFFEVRPAGSKLPYKPGNMVFMGNDCYFTVSQEEEYRIKIQNGSNELVFARILVDGLNTLSQRMGTTQHKGAFVEAVDNPEGEYELAPRVSLDEARSWVLLPDEPTPPVYTVSGFYDANGVADSLHRFQIVDADQSEAAQKGYTDQIGLITIGLFKAKKVEKPKELEEELKRGARAIGIGSKVGPKEQAMVALYQGDLVLGEMIVAFNIRYLTPEMLQTIKSTLSGN